MTQIDSHPPSPQALEQGYEPSDVSVRGIFVFLIIFVVGAVIIQFGLWELLKVYIALPRSADVVNSAAPTPARFDAPNLQPIETHNQLPWQDLADLQREKGAIFSEMGWSIDAETKEPVIPDQIVDQLAKERDGSGTTSESAPSGRPLNEERTSPFSGRPEGALSQSPSRGSPGEGEQTTITTGSQP